MKTSTRAVLFDLDGTLLDLDIDVLVEPYVKGLAQSVAHLVSPERFLPSLIQATALMRDNNGGASNAEVFAQSFYPAVGRSRQELEPFFEQFYADEFPKLRPYARRKAHAREAVQTAFAQGFDVVIATNPLFPSVAIRQRLAWAGVADFPYCLVTTYENSYAAKPNLAYYRHILGTIDQRAEHCVMVGDEDIDMVAAHLGCRTFLVPSARTNLASTTPAPTGRGTLADLIPMLRDM
jgi:HAD superfamily hydrolase (TIGR01549 family)